MPDLMFLFGLGAGLLAGSTLAVFINAEWGLSWLDRQNRSRVSILIKTLRDIVSYPTDSEVAHALQCAARDALEEYGKEAVKAIAEVPHA